MANTSGGIIIWGVECKNHVPIRADPVPHIRQLVERMKEATPGITDPPCPIEHVAVADSEGVGFAVSYVPRAERRPVAASCSDVNGYFMRSANNSVRMPHTIVEALVLVSFSQK